MNIESDPGAICVMVLSMIPWYRTKLKFCVCAEYFWMMTIYSDPITDLDLITEFDVLPNCERFR